MLVLLLSILVSAPPTEAVDTVVVCPEAFREALAPWITYREGQGHKIALLPGGGAAEEIRQAIIRQAESGKLRFVLLVGDADSAPQTEVAARQRSVPTHFPQAKVNVRWGSEPLIASDNAYADVDNDGLPDLAVGRITADSSQELTDIVRRIVAYESSSDMGMWRRRVSMTAGVGGFGPLVDSLLEKATKKFVTDCIPASYATNMTYGSWRSPFCPDPRQFHQTILGRFNEGCLFWIYMGHGQNNGLDLIRVPGATYPILDKRDASKLRAAPAPPIAVILSCYAGAFDGPHDCLAEEMLRAPGGPIAVLCGSRVTMPYAMAVMGNELLREYFQENRETLGELVMSAKRRMMAQVDPRDRNRMLLDALGAALSPAPDMLPQERAEHLLLFNLLGDPLLKLRHPLSIELNTDDTVDAGKMLTLSGSSPIAGRMTIEIARRRDRSASGALLRDRFDDSDVALAAYGEVYQRANDQRWASYSFNFSGGALQMDLPMPKESHGPCHVRVYIEGDGEFAMGSANIFVRRYRRAQPSPTR